MSSPEPRYMLATGARAARRLHLIDRIFGPATHEFLLACGLRPGTKSLRVPTHCCLPDENSRGKVQNVCRDSSAAHEAWKAGSSVDDCMKITGHKTSSMFKRYADLFSGEEKRAQQREVQSKRREWKKAQAENVITMPKRTAVQ